MEGLAADVARVSAEIMYHFARTEQHTQQRIAEAHAAGRRGAALTGAVGTVVGALANNVRTAFGALGGGASSTAPAALEAPAALSLGGNASSAASAAPGLGGGASSAASAALCLGGGG